MNLLNKISCQIVTWSQKKQISPYSQAQTEESRAETEEEGPFFWNAIGFRNKTYDGILLPKSATAGDFVDALHKRQLHVSTSDYSCYQLFLLSDNVKSSDNIIRHINKSETFVTALKAVEKLEDAAEIKASRSTKRALWSRLRKKDDAVSKPITCTRMLKEVVLKDDFPGLIDKRKIQLICLIDNETPDLSSPSRPHFRESAVSETVLRWLLYQTKPDNPREADFQKMLVNCHDHETRRIINLYDYRKVVPWRVHHCGSYLSMYHGRSSGSRQNDDLNRLYLRFHAKRT